MFNPNISRPHGPPPPGYPQIPTGYPNQAQGVAYGHPYGPADTAHYGSQPQYPTTYYQPSSYNQNSGLPPNVIHYQSNTNNNTHNAEVASSACLGSLFTGEGSTQTAAGFDASVISSEILGGAS